MTEMLTLTLTVISAMEPEELRGAIPALESAIYLNAGASGPSPKPVIDATVDSIQHHEYEAPVQNGAYPVAFDVFDETRDAVAAFLGASPSEISLTHSTADGISRVAASIDWKPGDGIVRTDLEHSAGTLPWWNLQREKCEVRVHETEHGRLDLDTLTDELDDARLLCLNSITWSHGTRLPIRDVVEIAHESDTLVLVDAVQSPGQTNVNVTEWNADFVVGAGHKWLLGPWGAGFLYVRDGVEKELTPAQVGYRSVVEPTASSPTFKPGAARLEVGTTNIGPYIGLQAAIETIESVGLDTIETRIERLTNRLKDGLGERCLSPRTYESGLVTFSVDNPEELVERLEADDIHVRALPFPDGAIRSSVHVYNTAEDIDALLTKI
jgi:cysteine desulfurase/selenocysteine lyase